MNAVAESISIRKEYNKLLLMLQQKESRPSTEILHYADNIIRIIGEYAIDAVREHSLHARD